MLFREKVLIEPLELYRLANPYADLVFYHQVSQRWTINKDDSLRKVSYKISCLPTETRCGYKYSLCRAKPNEAANKSLHIGTTNHDVWTISLRLHINPVET